MILFKPLTYLCLGEVYIVVAGGNMGGIGSAERINANTLDKWNYSEFEHNQFTIYTYMGHMMNNSAGVRNSLFF